MSDDEWAKLSDQQLAKIAQDGLQGQGAPVEAMRRLRLALEKAGQSSDRYSRRMLWLTVIITVLTAVQAISAIDVIIRWVQVGADEALNHKVGPGISKGDAAE